MSEKKTSVKVTILGEEYGIRSDATPEHTRAVASYVDEAIRRVMSGGNVVESQKAAILAALQITDELFAARSARGDMAGIIESLTEEVRRWLPPSKRGGAGATPPSSNG
ncbi:MAG TPA: cell division protein ZapA [Gemmatimonadaceae bacterium]|jgi:cell division protein ZapA|nr:cell division protein ZapA [Gemmatimonadaceae bacterium]